MTVLLLFQFILLFLFWFPCQFSCLVMSDSLRPMDCSTPGFPVHHQPLAFTQTHVHWVSDAIQPSHPLSFPSLPAFNLSHHQGLFKWVSSSHQVAKVLEFQLQHSPFNEHSELISFRMDWLDLLAVQGTLKSLLQYHSSKASILQHSAFFIVQLSHPYMTTGKTIVLTRWTFVDKVDIMECVCLGSWVTQDGITIWFRVRDHHTWAWAMPERPTVWCGIGALGHVQWRWETDEWREPLVMLA